ncbi:hypothetical protein DRQ53_08645 [bacterium]|nr:MAG: hypothetical protein DRQ53_08645 [bacterium]
MNALQKACRIKVEESFRAAEAHYNTTIKRVPIVFSNQQKKTAGTASYIRCFATGKIEGTQIKLANSILRLNPEEFVARTPGHEAAHIIAVELFGENGRGHGRRWQEIMAIIGQDAKRCHNMKTAPTRSGELFRYITTTGYEVMLKRGRHSKIQMKGATYLVRGEGKITKECFAPESTPLKIKEVTKAKAPAAPTASKAAKAITVCGAYKKMGYTLQQVLGNATLVEKAAQAIGTTAVQARKFLKGKWDQS